eukprot:TCONS_00021404-protein
MSPNFIDLDDHIISLKFSDPAKYFYCEKSISSVLGEGGETVVQSLPGKVTQKATTPEPVENPTKAGLGSGVSEKISLFRTEQKSRKSSEQQKEQRVERVDSGKNERFLTRKVMKKGHYVYELETPKSGKRIIKDLREALHLIHNEGVARKNMFICSCF